MFCVITSDGFGHLAFLAFLLCRHVVAKSKDILLQFLATMPDSPLLFTNRLTPHEMWSHTPPPKIDLIERYEPRQHTSSHPLRRITSERTPRTLVSHLYRTALIKTLISIPAQLLANKA